jgi:hypothetical protein
MGEHQEGDPGLSRSGVHAGAQEMLILGTTSRGVGISVNPRWIQIGRQVP